MNFRLTGEQLALKEQTRNFAKNEILPHWRRLRKKEFPWDIYRKLVEAGYAGGVIEERYGGAGLGMFEFFLVTEEMCRADGGVGLSIGASQSLVGKPIQNFGTDEQKNYWLPKIASGEILAAYCQTEPDSGSDVSSIKTRAHQHSYGTTFRITGTKQFITNGSIADLLLVLARTGEHKYNGLTCILVDAKKAREEGTLIVEKDFDKLGIHCSPTSTLVFQDCIVPALNILGAEGTGWPIAMVTLTGSRSMIAAQGVGLAQGALDEALTYVTQRKQFGKHLAEFQRVQGQLARIAMKLDAARLLGYRAAWLTDELGPMQAMDFMMEASMAKLYASEVVEEIASTAAELHGGMGFTTEARIGAIVEDARVLKIYEGTSAIQEYVIARQLLAKHGFKI
ncbi:MAG: hypothetical protein A3A28_05715 [Candidatus Sungbacteria bacterium RIFCSPLOWO2_01_FULL_47_32]|nr:MAG: hypothetical protein A3A28_05715 [Candidatus Sungbacteria bacterium RIFCSPLOWO2_01_FULL_47_32]